MSDTMIALFVSPADRAKLLNLIPESLRQYAQPEESLHLTLMYWEGETPENLRQSVIQLSSGDQIYLPMTGTVQGWGVFEQGEKRVLYASFDHSLLPNLRQFVRENVLTQAPISDEHGFVPHITLAYLPAGTAIPDLTLEPFDLTFDRLYLATDNLVVSNGPVVGVQELGKDLLETHFELAKSVRDLPNGDLEIIVKGVPFGGPAYLGGKDLTQEYFDKNTDIGQLPVVLSYFHHGKNEMFGKELLGKAELLDMDPEEGWFYRIIVDKAAKYKRAIKALAQQGWLGASSTPFQRTAEKSADGHWDRWHVVEVCLTYSPAHPEADVISVIEKSIGETMSDNIPAPGENPVPVEQQTPVADTSANNSTPAAAESVVAAVEKALNEGSDAASNFEAILEKSLKKFGDQQNAAFADRLAAIEKSIGEINVALPLIARKIATSLKTEVQDDLQKSVPERQVETHLRSAHNRRTVDPTLPADAPGNN